MKMLEGHQIKAVVPGMVINMNEVIDKKLNQDEAAGNAVRVI